MTAPAPLTPQALDGLEEKARAAYRDYGLADIAVGGGERATVTVPAYIAALSPSTALALIAAARAGEEMREALLNAVIALEALSKVWPDDHLPAKSVCIQMADAINNGNAILSRTALSKGATPMSRAEPTNAGGGVEPFAYIGWDIVCDWRRDQPDHGALRYLWREAAHGRVPLFLQPQPSQQAGAEGGEAARRYLQQIQEGREVRQEDGSTRMEDWPSDKIETLAGMALAALKRVEG